MINETTQTPATRKMNAKIRAHSLRDFFHIQMVHGHHQPPLEKPSKGLSVNNLNEKNGARITTHANCYIDSGSIDTIQENIQCFFC